MSNTLHQLVAQHRGRIDARRARLFLCACVRRMEVRGSFREAIELAERFADGRAGIDEVRSARYTYRHRYIHPADMLLRPDGGNPLDLVERGLIWLDAHAPTAADHAVRLALWRDLTGGDGVPFDPAWLAWDGGTLRRLAVAVAAERAFDQMPILGDALEEAGCADSAILEHCRGGGPHAHGCWVLEGLCGRAHPAG